jgi:D-glycero-D-manno-heptose 1,7-bisphosphate phosphatase
MKRRTIFFDRDGIINKRIVGDYVKNIEEFEFNPEIFDIFRHIKTIGYLAILVTNQQGIGKNIMTENDLNVVHDFMQAGLKEKSGYQFNDIYFCPTLEEDQNYDRKPNPGMLYKAFDKWNVDVDNSWMIGDSIKDAIAGKRANLRTILVGDFTSEECPQADKIFATLAEASDFIRTFTIFD